jgi:hypothetical protein
MQAVSTDVRAARAGMAERHNADEDMARQFHALPSAQPILRALHSVISNQLPITRKQLKFFPADDLAIGMAMLNKLETMVAGMAEFLRLFPGDTEAEQRE